MLWPPGNQRSCATCVQTNHSGVPSWRRGFPDAWPVHLLGPSQGVTGRPLCPWSTPLTSGSSRKPTPVSRPWHTGHPSLSGVSSLAVAGGLTPSPLPASLALLPVNYTRGWHQYAGVSQVSLATFNLASVLQAAKQPCPCSPRLRHLCRLFLVQCGPGDKTTHSRPNLEPPEPLEQVRSSQRASLHGFRGCRNRNGPSCSGSQGSGPQMDLSICDLRLLVPAGTLLPGLGGCRLAGGFVSPHSAQDGRVGAVW